MYLMPIEETIENKTYNYVTCVPDCSQYDVNFINNPSLMRCEYLGHLCEKGDYINGCISSYLKGGKLLP